MSASPNDKAQRTANGGIPATATVQSPRTGGVFTLVVDTQQYWPPDTGIGFSTYKVDTLSKKIPGTQTDWVGVSNGTNTLSSMVRVGGASDTGNAVGDKVRMGPTGDWADRLVRAFLAQHSNPNGAHTDITAISITTSANATIGGNATVAGTLTVAGKDVANLTPSGIMSPFAGASAPTGWLLCDGAAVSRTTYAVLFTAIGTAYGTGDGTTTFNLPNTKGKALFGADSGQAEFAAVAQTGGQKSVQSHAHGISDPGHRHAMWSVGQEGNSYPLSGPSTRVVLIGGNPDAGNGVTGLSGTGISVASAGSGANNLNPYLTVNYIIKT